MLDFTKQIEKLEEDAAECDLIAHLATDRQKREAFSALAEQYRSMARKLRQTFQAYSDERAKRT